jgi:hypothetical protein
VEQLDRIESGARGARMDGAVMASYANRTRKIVCIAGLFTTDGPSMAKTLFINGVMGCNRGERV